MTLYQVHFSFPSWADDREFYAGIDSQLFLHEEDAEQYRRDVMDGKVAVSCDMPDGSSVFGVEVCESYTPSTNAACSNSDCWEAQNDSDSDDDELDKLMALEKLRQNLEYPVVPSIDMLLKMLRNIKWKYVPWYETSAYYTLEDIVYDIQEVTDRLRWRGSYSNIGEQRERLSHKGVLDGGMVGEQVVECKFEFEGMLFCVATEANRVSVGFYPADSGNLAPFADEVWCIFYSDEDRPVRQRIRRKWVEEC